MQDYDWADEVLHAKIGRELYSLGHRPNQLYVVGSMGCASGIGLGVHLGSGGRKPVVVLDGDGAALMKMGEKAEPALQKAFAEAIPHYRQADLTDVLPTVRVPTQLIWGALDARSPLSVAREFERRIPGAQLAVIPQCGHVSNLEAPGRFNELVRGFLRHHG